VNLGRGNRRIDLLEPQLAIVARVPAHNVCNPIDRVGEQDVLRHHAEVVVDIHAHRVRFTCLMACLEEHGEAIVEDVLAHHCRRRDLRVPHVAQPGRTPLLSVVRQALGELVRQTTELGVIRRSDDHQRRPRPSAARPRDRLHQRATVDQRVIS